MHARFGVRKLSEGKLNYVLFTALCDLRFPWTLAQAPVYAYAHLHRTTSSTVHLYHGTGNRAQHRYGSDIIQ